MNKIFLIVKREYTTRVRKKSFLIMSVLGPVLFGLMFAVPIWLASRDGDLKVIQVLDESGLFEGKFEESNNIQFEYVGMALEKAKSDVPSSDKYGLLYIPALDLNNPKGITFFAEQNPSLEVQAAIERRLKSEIEDIKLEASGIDKLKLESIKTDVKIDTINLTSAGEKEGNTAIATGVGYFASLLIYFFIFLYGVQTLRGVIEEKSNRIVEVIISTVRPFQLMMGKIIGIGAVGLTQFLLWVVLTSGIYIGVQAYFLGDIGNTPQTELLSEGAGSMPADEAAEIFKKIETIDFPLIIGTFLFYFLAAYMFYGSLFAAVGSAVDNDSDAQQFQLPITLPLIFSIIILAPILKDPHGSLAVWTSIIPFTSPVVMMMRMPFDPPGWQIAVSMISLVIGFIFTTWLAGRIYRIGILMHGAKVNYRILARWLFKSY